MGLRIVLGTLTALVLAVATGGSSARIPPAAVHCPPSSASQPPGASYPPVDGKVAIYFALASTCHPADGGSFDVEVIEVNGTGHPFSIPDGCNGWLYLGLAQGGNVFEPGLAGVGCADLVVPTGPMHMDGAVSTTYGGCTDPFYAEPTMPGCVGPNQDKIPNLPPGTYDLNVDTTNVPHPVVPRPVTITLSTP